MVIGDANLWSDVFPEDLLPRVIDLITDTWAAFEKPSPSDLEVPITRRFKHALKQAKDFRRLPVRLERELVEDDPVSGVELGRVDLKFLPAASAREEVYFAIECKRLNASVNGVLRTLAPEYVKEGMMRFVTGQYAASMRHGGMLGYILDGRCNHSTGLIEKNIAGSAADLCMKSPAALSPSRFRPALKNLHETQHTLQSSRLFILHHILLDCGNDLQTTDAAEMSRSPQGTEDRDV